MTTLFGCIVSNWTPGKSFQLVINSISKAPQATLLRPWLRASVGNLGLLQLSNWLPQKWPLILGSLMLIITTPARASVTQLWGGTQAEHSCVVTSSSGVKCWGYNGYGQLGDNIVGDRWGPVDVKDSAGTGLLSGVTAVALGRYHTCAVLTGGAVKCWGGGLEGQVGDGAHTPRSLPVDVLNSAGSAPLTGVTAIAAGDLYTCALMTGGGVKCWGENLYGQLGDNTNGNYRYIPVDVTDSAGTGLLTGVTAITAGSWHTCAVMTGGGAKCWGNNPLGQLGDNTTTGHLIPVDVKDSAGTGTLTGVMAISGGYYYTCALLTGGGVKCWGENPYGQLGDGTVSQHLLPVDVKDSTGTANLTGVTAISTGLGHTCALLTGGGVKCWGYNVDGQPGDNTAGTNRKLPVDTKDLAGTGLLSNVIKITTGLYHSCALLGSGGGTSETSRVYCWGYNGTGRVGDNTAFSRLIPVIVNDTAPTATSVTLSLNPSGTPIWVTGETLRGNYTYIDADGEAEGSSLFQWYRATDATCTTAKTAIAGATSPTYTLTSSEEGQYVCFEVTPVASLGVSPGITVLATTGAPIMAGQIITFLLPASATAGDAPLILTATGGATGNPVTFASTTPSVCAVSGTTLTLISAGICTVTADQAGNVNYHAAIQVTQNITVKSPPVVVTPPPAPPLPPMTLKVSLSGTGTGRITSDVGGIDCSPTSSICTYTVNTPTWVTLTTLPGDGSQLNSWTGDPACTATGQVLIIQDTSCTAEFTLQSYQLTGNFLGRGRVTGPGIDCPGQCTATYLYGTTVTLEAQTARRWMWEFSGWRGCDSQGNIKITNDVLCQAVFTPDPNIPNAGDGNGDGLKDAYQDNVVSLPDKVTGTYLTLEALPATCVISDIYPDLAEAQTLKLDHTKKFPQGMLYFDIACPQAQVSVYYHGMSKLSQNLKFYKFGPKIPGDLTTLAWYQLPKVKYELVTIGGRSVVKGTYTLTDGQLGDSTGVDGHIVDPGGVVSP